MKTAYRIITPILAVGSVVMGFFLKMFTFVIGNADEQINNLIGAVTQLSGGKIKQTYEYSVFELIKMLTGSNTAATTETTEEAKSVTEILAPIMPHLVAFFVIVALVAIVFVAIAVISALKDSKKKRRNVIITSIVGIALLFVCIFVTNAAFAKVTGGSISLTDLVTAVSGSALAALATAVVSVTSATLSAGFYAMFGMFLLIIIWTIVANMTISTPIQAKKTYKRKKPVKKLSAIGAGSKGKKKKSKDKNHKKAEDKTENKEEKKTQESKEETAEETVEETGTTAAGEAAPATV